MDKDYTERWCQFFAAILAGEIGRGDHLKTKAHVSHAAALADSAIEELIHREANSVLEDIKRRESNKLFHSK